MAQYGLSFGFREPYQVLLDAEIIRDADRFKMDLIGGIERTLHGQVKPSEEDLKILKRVLLIDILVITQCCMRHLYAAAKEPGVSYLIDKAKTFERRRCGHLPDEYPEPLSAEACIASVVDPKDNKTNKHRYVVASQELDVRKHMRSILGVPLIYINRSVMIMEPMAEATVGNREKDERLKFRAGLKRGSGSLKRKREDEDGEENTGSTEAVDAEDAPKKKKKFVKGVKGPNPLAVKKSKKSAEGEAITNTQKDTKRGTKAEVATLSTADQDGVESKSKRKRKHKPKAGADDGRDAQKSEAAE